MVHRSPVTTGSDAGAWCPDGGAGDWPVDQRAEDGRSLTFTSEPLDVPLEILGSPEVRLELAVDRPNALIAVRLCDVAPDGTSLLVTRGLLNRTHRDAHDSAEPLEPGRRYAVTVKLDAIGQAIPIGHRVRVAVSTSYWPWAWPSPEFVTLTVHAGQGSRLVLPVRVGSETDRAPPPFAEPEWSEPLAEETLRSDPSARTLTRDLASGAQDIRFEWDAGGRRRLVESGTELDDTNVTTWDRRGRSALGGGPVPVLVHARARRLAHARRDREPHDRDGDRVPRHARPRRLRGRRARVLPDVDADISPGGGRVRHGAGRPW